MLFKAAGALAFLPYAALAAEAGWSGTLSSLDGGLGGTVKVINDTALMISNYELKDASAPALYWWGSTTNNLRSGFRISNERVDKPATTDSITIPLDAGKTAADFSVVGLWCERFNANFGQATLSEDGGGSPDSKPPGGGREGAAVGRASGYEAAVAVMFSAAAFVMYLT